MLVDFIENALTKIRRRRARRQAVQRCRRAIAAYWEGR